MSNNRNLKVDSYIRMPLLMKTHIYIYISILFMLMFSACGKKTDREYLSEVLENMNKVNSVKYHCVLKSWEPGDNEPVYDEQREIYEHVNPEDSAIGYSYIIASDKEFKHPLSVYDGTVQSYIEEKEKEIVIDDFTRKMPVPFRIIYALNTNDSIVLTLKDEGKDFLMELTINMPNQVEFFGKAQYIPENPYIYDPTSIYKVWISKENDMPYRYRREMQHSINEEICSGFVFNPSGMGKIIAEDYYPEGYERYIRGQKKEKPAVDMTGKTAPEWTLTDINDRKISLSSIKSKIILLQLTGIGCGPCKVSIPFLIKRKSSSENYIRKNDIKYKFLTADKESIEKLINDYQAGSSVPQFYLIGKDRKILKKFQGYAEKISDKEIEDEIKKNL